MSKCRGLLVCYEKKAGNYLAPVQWVRALIRYPRWHRLWPAGTESGFCANCQVLLHSDSLPEDEQYHVLRQLSV